ncbi:hypothetical protein [Candidatus Alkanophaga liquidiphilum]
MSFETEEGRVFFMCECGYVFQESPYKFPIRCPQCGSENVSRT